MRAAPPFSWLATPGWIILSGSADALGEIRARALSRCDASGDIAYISLAPDRGDALMDDLAELGAASGYLVDLDEADSNEVYERLSNAAMIVIEAPASCPGLLPLLRITAAHAMKEALQRGALILLEGAAAAALGEFALEAGGALAAGLGYVQNTLICAQSAEADEQASLMELRRDMPEATFVTLPGGAALALGPGGAIETWGERQVSISLGSLAMMPAGGQPERAME